MNDATPTPPPVHCECVPHHHPPAHVIEKHHIEPKSWGGADTPENQIAICVQTHYTVHEILDRYVRWEGSPPQSLLAIYPAYALDIAARGWASHLQNNSTHPTPYGP